MNKGNVILSGWSRCAVCKQPFKGALIGLLRSDVKPARSFMNNPG
jgi:hypothetical protein